jgi:putative ABC transport system permease protein
LARILTSNRRPRPASTSRSRPAAPGLSPRPLPTSGQQRALAGLLRLTYWRLRDGWRALLALGIGVLAAVVLFAAVPVVSDQTAELGLRDVLRSGDLGQNVQLTAAIAPLTSSQVAPVEPAVNQLANETIAAYMPQRTMYLASDTLLLARAGARTLSLSASGAPAAQLLAYDYAQATAHMRLSMGAWPAHAGDVLVTDQMAARYALRPGQTIIVAPFGAHTRTYPLLVVGSWSPQDANDAFWMGRTFSADATDTGSPTYPLLVTRESIFGAGAALGAGGVAVWDYFLAPASITAANVADVGQRVATFRSRAQDGQRVLGTAQTATVATALDALLNAYTRQREAIALPLYLVAAQVLGLVLFYVAAMASTLVEQQSAALAVMKSRGASRGQVLGSYALQGLLIGALAVAAGPWLVRPLVRWLVGQLIGADAGPTLSPSTPPPAAMLAAIVAALLALATIVLATVAAARRDILAFRRETARYARAPLWQRLYLDLALAALCAAGYYELGQTSATTVSRAPDALLLLTPGLLLVAGALVVARTFPLAARMASAFAARRRGAAGFLALLQLGRTPSRYVRLVLLVTLAAGLGVFTQIFSSSLEQHLADHAAYTAGADLRVTLSPGADPRSPERIAHLPGVEAASRAVRTAAALPATEGSRPVDLLAVETGTLGHVAAWRDDYAPRGLPALLGAMASQSSRGTLWAAADTAFMARTHARIGDVILLTPTENPAVTLRVAVGVEVRAFPTLDPTSNTGFVVVDLASYEGAIRAGDPSASLAPNEVWMAISPSAADALHRALSDSSLSVASVLDRRQLVRQYQSDPLTAGLRGMLLLGVAVALGLMLLGTFIAAAFDARQRMVQFATLRALGASGQQIGQLLLTEQGAVYTLGVVAGSALGAFSAGATLPLVRYVDLAAGTTGGPAAVLTVGFIPLLAFYLALVAGAVLSLLASAGYLVRLRPAHALRVNED